MPERVFSLRALAMPLESTLPQLWTTCGRREREAEAENGGAILLTLPFATVEGTLVLGKTLPFAGRVGTRA
jgi:hypothetical protein